MNWFERNNFLLRRLHSLTGVVPIGAFLVEHLLTNSFALGGEKYFNDQVAFLMGLPYLYVIEALFIFIPIIFHGVLGLTIVFEGQVNVGSERFFRNWMYVLQRATGIFLLFYISAHVWSTRFSGEENLFALMQNTLANPYVFWFYIVGVLCATFHFANGLWGFMVTWGITVSVRAQNISTYVCGGIFLALSFIGINSLLAFTGGAITLLQR